MKSIALLPGIDMALIRRLIGVVSVCLCCSAVAQTESQNSGVDLAEKGNAQTERELKETISLWAGAWAAQLTEPYIGYYTSSYYPPNFNSRDEWVENRRERIESPESIHIRLLDFELIEAGPLLAIVQFTLMYSRPGYSDRTVKELELIRLCGAWRISEEKNLSVEELQD